MAKGYSEIQSFQDAAQRTKQTVAIGYQYRSAPLYQKAIKYIQEGKIGKLVAFECHYNRNGDWRKPVPSPELERVINWRMYREYSGGLLAELCSHQMDFVHWALQAAPAQVIGTGGIDYWKDGRETYDNIHLIYSYANGIKASFTSLTSNAMEGFKIKALGDAGSIILDFENGWFYPENVENKTWGNMDGVSGATTNWDAGKGIPMDLKASNPTQRALEDFYASVVHGRAIASPVETAAVTARAVQMGLDAMYSGETVKAAAL